jgi:hypothetical protein
VWKKRKDIEGVSASSMLELKAELYEREQLVKRQKSLAPADAKASKGKAPLDARNRGVEARAARDLAHSQAETDVLANSAAQLARKAAMYAQMQRSASSSAARSAEHDLVDWQQKAYDWSGTQLQSADTRREQERLRWEQEQRAGDGDDNDDDDAADRERDERLATLDSVIALASRERAATNSAREQRQKENEMRAALIRQKADDRRRRVAEQKTSQPPPAPAD